MMRARSVSVPRAVAVVVATIVLFAAPSAWSLCPNCLGQSSTLSSTLKVVGVFLLVPPTIVLAVTLVIRRLARREQP
jgi:hypothetical protein